MPRSTLASNPRKGTAHEKRTTRKPKRLTPGDTLRLRLCSPLAKHFESQGETLVLGLVAVQLASSQLTPRITAIVFRDPVTKVSLVLFVFTFTFTLAVLVRVSSVVPALT